MCHDKFKKEDRKWGIKALFWRTLFETRSSLDQEALHLLSRLALMMNWGMRVQGET
jgi:hypothetical protein